VTDPAPSAYPAANIARDVAGTLVATRLRMFAAGEPPEVLDSLLARRCADVGRHDLAASLDGVGAPAPGRELLAAAKAAVPALLAELQDHAEHGPNPTPEVYAAACVALDRHRRRADLAEAAVQRVRDLCDAARAMNLGHNITVGEVLEALDGAEVPA
jgi:hypothetical protein